MIRISLALICALTMHAEDWPEWRGKGRTGVWNETGILTEFPKDGLTARWRTPLKSGFSGPAVADGRVFVTDFVAARMLSNDPALILQRPFNGLNRIVQLWIKHFTNHVDWLNTGGGQGIFETRRRSPYALGDYFRRTARLSGCGCPLQIVEYG